MGFPGDAVQPFLDCMDESFVWPPISGPGGLSNFALAGFGSCFAGISFVLDFLPPDPENLPSLPTPALFIAPFFAGLSMPGDLGEFDFSLTIPGGPTIPATGTNILFNQEGFILMSLAMVGLPFAIITDIVLGIIDELTVTLPTLEIIIATFNELLLGIGLGGIAVTKFVGCFSQAFLDMILALFP